MSRQTPVITPSSESPVWRSISAFITRGLRSKEKHSVENDAEAHTQIPRAHYISWERWQKIPVFAQTICGRFIRSIKYLGSLKLLIWWFLAVNFRFPSNPLSGQMRHGLSPGLLRKQTCWKKWTSVTPEDMYLHGRADSWKQPRKQKKGKAKHVGVKGPHK